MRISVRWVSRVELSAELDVDLAVLAHWALASGAVRKLGGTTLSAPTADELAELMGRNGHLRSRIAQQYAISHELDRRDPGSRRDERPSPLA